MRRWLLIALAGVVLVGLVVGGREVWQRIDQRRQCEDLTAEAKARNAVVLGSGERVAVIGDSYAAGLLLDNPEDAWPSQLATDFRVKVDVFGGTGFTDEVLCPGHTFGERARAVADWDPDVVVIQGGLNDSASSAETIADGVEDVARALPDDVPVLLVGPPIVTELDEDGIAETDGTYAGLAAKHGWDYLSLVDWDLDFQDDKIHPTQGSQDDLGRMVLAEVRRIA
jgi:acyl-CoA thioesterase-1